MFDINKMLGKKKNKMPSFGSMNMSNTFGKNPLSKMIGGITKNPLKTFGASPKLQNQWKNFSVKTKNNLRKQFKDTDGDRIPNKWDCQPKNPMRQDTVYHGTTPLAAMRIKKTGILTSNELKNKGNPEFVQSDKTRPDKTYFFKDKARAESWANVVTAGSMFPDANPTVVVADVPGDELFPDGEMETGGAFYKEGSVPASQIKKSYEIKPKYSAKDIAAADAIMNPKQTQTLAVSSDGRKQKTMNGSLM